jgi:hypothetical protein
LFTGLLLGGEFGLRPLDLPCCHDFAQALGKIQPSAMPRSRMGI